MAFSLLLRVMCLPFWVVILRVTKQEIERRKSVSLHPLVTPQSILPHSERTPRERGLPGGGPRGSLPQDPHTGGLSAEVASHKFYFFFMKTSQS